MSTTCFRMHYAIPDAQVGVCKIAMFAFRCGFCDTDFHIDFTPKFCPNCGLYFAEEKMFGESSSKI